MKKLVIISMSRGAAQEYTNMIFDVFGKNRFEIEIAIIGEGDIPRDADIYLASKGHIENRMGTDMYTEINFPVGIPVIDILVEFRTSDVAPLFELAPGTKCLLVNSTEMLAMECISDLHNSMGVYHLAMLPYAEKQWIVDENIKYAITVGEKELIPPFVENTIDLGIRWLSPETMVEIAVNLKMEEVLENEAFLQYRNQFAASSMKVRDLVAGSSYYKNIFHSMIECLDDGIVGINKDKKIFCVNQKASEIFETKAENIIGTDFKESFPFFKTDKYLELRESSSFVTKFKGITLNIFVNPIYQRGNFKGILLVVKKFFEQEQKQNKARLQLLERGYKAKYSFSDIIGNSETLRMTCQLAKKMALSDSTILITGETGTGKELLASAIHNESARKKEAYIAINCSAISDDLLESELFGYDEGAFTGAKKSGKPGLFEYAHKGTLFLDEIEDMSPALQLKLLRVLQEKEIMHIGGDRIIKVDVRIIAATNQNLEELVHQGKIRKDLYYRLNTLQLELPPLRKRREDIMPLFNYFKEKNDYRFELSSKAQEVLIRHSWDGNVRELQNYVEYLGCIQKDVIEVEDLPNVLRKNLNVSEKNIMAIDKEELLILEILYQYYCDQIHVGRKVLSLDLSSKGVFLSEAQVRSLLTNLESKGFVKISKGRGGTYLTLAGKQFYEQRDEFI